MVPGVIEAMEKLAAAQPRFRLLSNLTKEEYYHELATAKIQFNSSLQDYVSWTVLESTAFGCDVVFPNFRSFPEFIPQNRLYVPFDVSSAVLLLEDVGLQQYHRPYRFAEISDLGRRLEAFIILSDYNKELNVWHEEAYCQHLINEFIDTHNITRKG
jgi:hypothetical protein